MGRGFSTTAAEILNVPFQKKESNLVFLDRGFVQVRTTPFANAVIGMGEAQFRFFLFLLCRCKKGFIKGTVNELMHDAGADRDTIRYLLRHLKEYDFVRRVETGKMMVNPQIISDKNEAARNRDIHLYRSLPIQSGSISTIQAKPSQIAIIDFATGEMYEGAVSGNGKCFVKLWPERFVRAFAGLGRKQLQFGLYLLTHILPDGCVYGTVKELADDAEVKPNVAYTTIKLLSERRFLVRVARDRIMINPAVVSFDILHRWEQDVQTYIDLIKESDKGDR